MIISRTPLRVSFCGGGSDLPSYYRRKTGCVISTSINKYIYLSLNPSFDGVTRLKYSEVESVTNNNKIRHPVFRETLKKYRIDGVEINSAGDVPAGTGLGSSSTFTVGLTYLIRTCQGMESNKHDLAEEACDMEINILGEHIGKQDQYAASYGGLRYYRFNRDDSVDVEEIKLSAEEKNELNGKLMMFYLGGTRSASQILNEQTKSASTGSKDEQYDSMCSLTKRLKSELDSGNYSCMGKYLHEGWMLKKSLSSSISNEFIDGIYESALDAGAQGGKLLGAGGNGFMLFYADEKDQPAIIDALDCVRYVDMRFDDVGTCILFNDGIRTH